MNRRTALTTALALPALTSCYYGQYFDVTWDEEVKLHDASVIVVTFKFVHERLSRFSKYDRAILRDTTMAFDAGPSHGRVSQTFNRMQPVLLNKYEGEWYAVIEKRGAGDSPSLTGQDWGPRQTAAAHWPLKLRAGAFKTIPIAEFPDPITSQNLVRNLPPEEMASYDGKRIDLDGAKAMLVTKHVIHPDDRMLKKPKSSTTNSTTK
jgi:hypothetical protein